MRSRVVLANLDSTTRGLHLAVVGMLMQDFEEERIACGSNCYAA